MVIVIDKKFYFAFLLVVVVEEWKTVSGQLAADYQFIDGAKVDTFLIIHDGGNIVLIQQSRKQANIVQIELEQIFAFGFHQRKLRIGNGFYLVADSAFDKVLKFILILNGAGLLLVLDLFESNPLLLVLQIGGDEFINALNLQFVFFVVLACIAFVCTCPFK